MAGDSGLELQAMLVKKLSISPFVRILRTNRALGFLFLLAKCAFKCGVDHTLGQTLASLNYERFHADQVKLKRVGTFYPFTPKVGSKYNVHLHCT